MLASIDLWLGKHVFVPPIVMLRKMTGWDKRATVILLYGAWALVSIIVMAAVFTPFSIFMGAATCVIAASYIPFVQKNDAALVPNEGFRRIYIALNAMITPVAIIGGVVETAIPLMFLLACEYAKTIDTLPPDRKIEPSAQRQNA